MRSPFSFKRILLTYLGFAGSNAKFKALESRCGSKRQLDALLASQPRSLDKTYEPMLLNIDEESGQDATRILNSAWLCQEAIDRT